ncbi:MAG: glycerol-3-phosphate acyltransferase [Chloroflexota bacterium]
MSNFVYVLLAALIGYVLGAIPFGFLYVKATRKVDLRTVGSGRTGGTNSFRAAGLAVGVLTSISDALKGAAGVWIVNGLFRSVLDKSWLPWALVTAGLMSVVGHNWSVFLKWAGGAGTGPNVGWSSALWPPMLPIALVVVVGLLLGVGMASVASLAAAVVVPVVFAIRYFTGHGHLAYLVGGVVTAAVIIYALRSNIKRILNGTERLVGPRARRQAPAK